MATTKTIQKIEMYNDCHAIPFKDVVHAIDSMVYGSEIRVMFEMLFLTGCRIVELDRMYRHSLIKDILYWSLGKNQKGKRKVVLPMSYINELHHYRQYNRVSDRLFGVSSSTLRRRFNKDIRPNLGLNWNTGRFYEKQGKLGTEYLYQLKGLRKDYQTLEFAKQLDKWKDSGVALEFTSKKMRHKSTRITAYHYIENFDALGINDYINLTPADIIKSHAQKRINDYF